MQKLNILILKFMSVIVALYARAGQCIFCEQVVRVNQEQFHFGYIKLDTLPICSTRDKKNGTKYIVPFLYI